jgi:branched-chain amino acid transport system substrate-binding protein
VGKKGLQKVAIDCMILMLIVATLLAGGCAKPAPTAPEEPIKIGLLADKTGGLAAYGYAHEKVANAVIDKINAEGGIAGRSIKLYVEDTESEGSVGALKMRKLIETYDVDFVVGTNTSAVVFACTPIAKELRTVYFPTAGGSPIGAKGNRYVFDLNTDCRQECAGAAKFAVENLGKNWVTVVVDYAWGWDQETEFARWVSERGGTVLTSIRVPMGTSDWLPYLKGKIPAAAEGVYFANFGSDFLCFIRDLYAVRPDIHKLGGCYVLSGQDPAKLGAPAEGLYAITIFPTRLAGLDTPYNREYRKTIGMDDEGKEVGTGRYLVPAYQWSTWETMFVIKEVIEKTGWKGKDDNPAFIQALEGMHLKESYEHPQGDKYVRPEDHVDITGVYLEQVRNGEIVVIKKIPAEDMIYPPTVDFTKEPF